MRTRLLVLALLLTGCPQRETGGSAPAASAAPAASIPTTLREVTIPCMAQASGKPMAVKEYPGRSRADLTRVVVLNCHTGGAPGCHPVGQTSIGLKDGQVAAWCEPNEVPSLVFVSPF